MIPRFQPADRSRPTAEQAGKASLWVAAGALVVGLLLLWALVYGAREMKESWKKKNELHARETLAAINRALAAYHRKYEGYPNSLQRLRGGEEGRPEVAPPERARLLASELARDDFERSGYRIRFQPGPGQQRWAATVQLHSSYRATAEPLKPGSSADAFYYTDEKGGLHARQSKKAGPDDPVVQQ